MVQVRVEGVVGEQLAGRALACVEIGREGVEAAGGIVQAIVEGVVGEELADGAMALIEADGEAVQLGERGVGLVIEVRIGDQLADGAPAGVQAVDDAVEPGDGAVKLFQGALARLHEGGDGGQLLGWQLRIVPEFGALGGFAVQFDDGVADNAGGGEGGDGVGVEAVAEAWIQLQGELDRGGAAGGIVRQVYVGDFTYGNAFQIYRGTDLDPLGVREVGTGGVLLLKRGHAGGAGEQEKEDDQEDDGDQHQNADPEL